MGLKTKVLLVVYTTSQMVVDYVSETSLAFIDHLHFTSLNKSSLSSLLSCDELSLPQLSCRSLVWWNEFNPREH